MLLVVKSHRHKNSVHISAELFNQLFICFRIHFFQHQFKEFAVVLSAIFRVVLMRSYVWFFLSLFYFYYFWKIEKFLSSVLRPLLNRFLAHWGIYAKAILQSSTYKTFIIFKHFNVCTDISCLRLVKPDPSRIKWSVC